MNAEVVIKRKSRCIACGRWAGLTQAERVLLLEDGTRVEVRGIPVYRCECGHMQISLQARTVIELWVQTLVDTVAAPGEHIQVWVALQPLHPQASAEGTPAFRMTGVWRRAPLGPIKL